MERIFLKPRAKINLNLEITGKRPDNYHNINSVFQKISLYDELYIYKLKTDEFILETNFAELNNKDNIIYKAYESLKNRYKSISGVKVILNKKIPMKAGLGGGSTDCASFILGINKLFNLNLSKEEIEQISKKLGADVVPCLYNKAILAEGIGDVITKINTNFKYYILIIRPNMSCSTKEMYNKIDEKNSILQKNTTKEIIKALETNNINLLAKNMYNVFEEAIEDKLILNKIKNELLEKGACGSLMTGSGSCIYGIFDTKENVKRAYKNLKEKYEVYFAISSNL